MPIDTEVLIPASEPAISDRFHTTKTPSGLFRPLADDWIVRVGKDKPRKDILAISGSNITAPPPLFRTRFNPAEPINRSRTKMDTHHKIRTANEADVGSIAKLIMELDLYHQPLEPDFVLQGAPKPTNPERLLNDLDDDSFVVLVADMAVNSKESVVGFVRMQINERNENRVFKACRVGTVHELAVAKDGRRKGIGKALMEAVHAAAREHRVQYIELSHFAKNVSTGRFYDDIGYRPFLRHLVLGLE